MSIIQGSLQIEKHYPDGRIEVALPWEDNMVMRKQRARILVSTYTMDPTNSVFVDPITEFRVGSGNPLANPEGTETSLVTPIVSGYTPGALYYNLFYGAVTYGYSLGVSQLNGETINEAGLFTRSGALFSLKRFPDITKDGTFALVFRWKLSV
jgi:hypothetical protein